MYFYKFYNSIQILKKNKIFIILYHFLKYKIKFKFNFIFIWELFIIFQVSLICVWIFIARWSTKSSTDIFIRGNHSKLFLKWNLTIIKNYYILLQYLYFILLHRYDGKKILLLVNHLDFYILGGGKHYMFYILLKKIK